MPNIITNVFGEEIIIKTEEELAKENQPPSLDIFKDVMSSLNFKTRNVFLEEEEAAYRAYVPYVINLCYSYVDKYGKNDSLFFANEMNTRADLDPKLQYEFYFYGLSKAARFGKGAHADEINNLELVMDYYNYSVKKAKEALDILTPDQLETIKNRMSKGELKNVKSKRGKKST